MLTAQNQLALMERDQELRLTAVFLAEAAAGEGTAFLAQGPAGIGKTRVLEAVIEQAAPYGFDVHRGRGEELEAGFPYGVIRQLFEGAVGDLEPGVRERLSAGAPGLALSLLDGRPVELPDRADDDGVSTVAYSLYWLVQEMADVCPQLLVVDDVQWADTPSLRVLHFLGRRLEGLPVVEAFACRTPPPTLSEDLTARLGALPRMHRLRLRPLGEEAVGELVRNALGEGISGEARRALWLATRGNPLMVRELLTSVDTTHLERLAGDPVALARLAPASIGEFVLRRIDEAGEGAKRLAQAVAIFGHAALSHAAALGGIEEAEAIASADRLVAADVLEATPHLQFVHPVLREVVLMSTPPAQRALAHARAARMLGDSGAATEHVSAHLLEALPRGDAWAAKSLLDSGTRARSCGAPKTAIRLLRRALDEPPPPELRWRVALELGISEAIAGDPLALNTLEKAVEWAQEPSDRMLTVLRLARMTAGQGDHHRALALIDELTTEPRGVQTDLLLQLQVEQLGMARLVADTREQALDRLERLRDGAFPPRPATVGLLSNLALSALERNARPDDVAELARLSMTAGSLLEDETFQLAYAAGALIWIDYFDEAQRIWDDAVDTARTRGSLTLAVLAHSLRSHLQLRRGAVADAEADARIAHQIATEHGWRHGVAFTGAHLASALLERGAKEEARRVLHHTAPDEHTEKNPFYLHSCGQLHLAESDPAAAYERFLACGQALTSRGGVDTPSMFAWRSQAALALLQLGERQQAHSLAVEELELARIMGVPGAVGEALVAAALTERGQNAARLLQAVTVLEDSPRTLALTRGLLELGALLRRQGQRRAAQPFLRRAFDLANRQGATVLADRARIELKASGARPRRSALTGADALTPSERRIAHLAAEGLSNRDIAQRLYVSARTVATHLTHVYQKLGVDGREQLCTTFPE